MFRKPARKDNDRTTPDHRPMISLFRKPGDELDAAVRSFRLEKANPTPDINWRWNHGPIR